MRLMKKLGSLPAVDFHAAWLWETGPGKLVRRKKMNVPLKMREVLARESAAGVAAGVAIVAGLAGGGGSGGGSSSGGSSGGGSDGGIVEPPGEGELPVGVFCGEPD